MKILIATLVASFTLSALASTPRFDNSKLFVKMTEGQKLSKSQNISDVKHLFKDVYLVTTTDAEALQKELALNPNVSFTEKNYFAGSKELPKMKILKTDVNYFQSSFFNDPQVSKIWAFLDSEKHGVSVEKAYMSPLNLAKEEIIVAVVDTGVDYNHEDLKDVMWRNPNEIVNGLDDDGNGYIDDIHGIDTLKRNAQGVASGDPMASHAHGTHVAGTIGATQNNGTGIAGIASNVKIMAIRTVPDNADETDVDIVESFLYAAKHGAKIINCSFGKSHNEGGMIVNETITHIGEEYGVLTYAAAGNDSMFFKHDIDKKPKYPAAFDSDYLVVIASTESRGGLSGFSNVGLVSVDLAAPGSNVYSTVPGNGYANMSGTSMATPTAVGVTAEVWSHFPDMGALEMKKLMMDSTTKVDKFKKYMVTGGRIDLYEALQLGLKRTQK